MDHIKVLLKKGIERDRKTERGELLRFFCHRLNVSRARDGLTALTMARMGKILEKIPTKDLYYLKTVCDQAENFSKKFWYELNPEKYSKSEKSDFRNKIKK